MLARFPAAGSPACASPVPEDGYSSAENVWSASHRDRARRYRDQRILPDIGKWPIREVTPADVLKLLHKAEKAGPHVAIVARQTRSSVSEHAIVPRHPVRRAIKKPPVMDVVAHFAVTLGKLLAGLEAYAVVDGVRHAAAAVGDVRP